MRKKIIDFITQHDASQSIKSKIGARGGGSKATLFDYMNMDGRYFKIRSFQKELPPKKLVQYR